MLTGVGNLEENVLHDITAIGALEFEWLATKVDVVKAPGGSGQDGRQTSLTLLDLQAKVDGGLAGITGCP